MAVDGMRQAEQVLKVDLLRGRTEQVDASHHAVHPLCGIVDDDGELIGKGLVGATNKEITAIALEVLGIVALY